MEEGTGWRGEGRRIVTVVSESCRLLTAAAVSSSYLQRSDYLPSLKTKFGGGGFAK